MSLRHYLDPTQPIKRARSYGRHTRLDIWPLPIVCQVTWVKILTLCHERSSSAQTKGMCGVDTGRAIKVGFCLTPTNQPVF